VWESFGDVGFPTSEKVWREKKERKKHPQNNKLIPLALATLERATIKWHFAIRTAILLFVDGVS